MKKKLTIASILLLLFIFTSTGCTNKQVQNPETIKVGVVETMGTKYRSFIHWYDDALEVVDVQKLKYASLGDTFRRPVYDGEDVFLIPEGIFTKKDTKKVISLNKTDFSVTTFPVPNIALADVAITADYIFTNSNLNYETHLSRVDRGTKEFTEKIYEGAYFHALASAQDKLFLFGNLAREVEATYLYVLDTDFQLLETIDLTEIGVGGYKWLLDDPYLYVSMVTTIEEAASNRLLKVNVNTYETEVIELAETYPDSIVKYEDTLIIAHTDIIIGEGSLVTVLDLITGEQRLVDLKIDAAFMDAYDDKLVVCDGEKVSLFNLAQDFELIKSIVIDKQEADSYLSNIIVID